MALIEARLLIGTLHSLIQIAWIWAILVPVELLLPRGRQVPWKTRLRGLSLGVISWTALGFTGTAVTIALGLVGVRPLFAVPIDAATGAQRLLWIVGGTALSTLGYDFLYYWFHRMQHRWMWRQHAVHHAIEDLNALNYLHWTEELTRIPFISLPLALLMPASLPILSWAAGVVTLQSMYIHSPIRLHLGPFWRLVFDNRFHRVHHSVEPRHFDSNFGVLTPLWDWMFGTLYVPAKNEWPPTGIQGTPEVDGLADYLWRPFRGPPSALGPPVVH